MRSSPARLTRFGLALGLLGSASLAGGCVTSERAEYVRHLDARVQQGAASDDDLAFAFGLGPYAASPLARRDTSD